MLTGTIKSVSGERLTVEVDGEARELNMSGAQIVRKADGKKLAKSDLKNGMRVELRGLAKDRKGVEDGIPGVGLHTLVVTG